MCACRITAGSYVRQAGQAPEATGWVHGIGCDQWDVEDVIPENHVLGTLLGARWERLVEYKRVRVEMLSQHHARPLDELDVDRGDQVRLRAPRCYVRGDRLVLDEDFAHVQHGLHRSDELL